MNERFFDRNHITKNVVQWQNGQKEPNYYLKKKD